MGPCFRHPVSKSCRSVTAGEEDVFGLSGLLTITLLSPKVVLDNCRDMGCLKLHLLCRPTGQLSHLPVGEASSGLLCALGTMTEPVQKS